MKVECPICGTLLPDEKYNLVSQKLQQKLETMTNSKLNEEKNKFEKEKQELVKRNNCQKEDLKHAHKLELDSVLKAMKESYESQMDGMRKSYDKAQESQFRTLKQENNQKNSIIKKLEDEKAANQKEALVAAKAEARDEVNDLRKEILGRDIQLQRFKDEVESLKKQISQSQAELKGEVGEIDLFAKLTEAFPEDQFRRQIRGKSSGDIIQQIRTASGKIDMPIVYDNKNAESITSTDIIKAKKYQQVHGTRYIIIVSTKLPKRDVNSGYLGERDGIHLVHPAILVPFVKLLRAAIIETSLLSKSEKDRESKEAILYEYIRSQDFTSRLEHIGKIREKVWNLQDKEEKDHQKMWKERKEIFGELDREQTEISLKIQVILSKEHEVRASTNLLATGRNDS
jgi:hypothetical protein